MSNIQFRAFSILVLALSAVGGPAFAQAQIQQLTQYGVTNIGKPMVSAAVVILGVFAMLMRLSLGVVGLGAIGGLMMANYQQIAGLIGGV